MSYKQQQFNASNSRIPRLDPRLLTDPSRSQLKKSTSHFIARELENAYQKRRSDPDILRSTCDRAEDWNHKACSNISDNLFENNVICINESLKIKREDLSLSHLPSVLSSIDDDNVSLDSLGILTPNQMKDFLEEEATSDTNIVEVIDLNGQKIECKLHYEDMQWSSPFLHLSGDETTLRNLINPRLTAESERIPEESTSFQSKSGDSDLAEKVSRIAEPVNEGGYVADNESDIGITNQQIIEIIQKASLRPEKKVLSIVPLSESGYNADNESDVLSDASPSPTEENYPSLDKESAIRESVTDSGFYSETRNSCMLNSESDFEESPRFKARGVQVIDGKLYYSYSNMTDKAQKVLSESIEPVNVVNDFKDREVNPTSGEESGIFLDCCQVVENGSKVEAKEEVMEIEVAEQNDLNECPSIKEEKEASKVNNKAPKSVARQNVVSKLKQMIDTKAKDNIDVKTTRRASVPKKNKWDSITAKIAASMADDKKVPKREARSRIDCKSQVILTKREPNKVSNNVKTSKGRSVVPTSKETSSQQSQLTEMNLKGASGVKRQDSKSIQKENRPGSARSNYSDASRNNSLGSQTKKNKVSVSKLTKNNSTDKPNADSSKSVKNSSVTKAAPRNSLISNRLNAKRTPIRKIELTKPEKPHVSSNAKKPEVKKPGVNSLKIKKDGGIDVSFDQPDLIATAEFEVKINELKQEKEKIVQKNDDLEQELNKLNGLYDDERVKFVTQLSNLKSQIKTIHIQYGEEAQKQDEKINKLYKELELTTSSYSDKYSKAEQRISSLESELKSVDERRDAAETELRAIKEERQSDIEILNDKWEQKIEEMNKDHTSQMQKMKNSHKLMQEIESLKIVLDLKTEEMHSLRKQNMEMTKEVEEFASTKEKVKKMTAKIEDLQEILNIKSGMERSLTLEHESLKLSVETESKVNKRLSMEIEELQWKLKHSDNSDCESLPLSPGLTGSMHKSLRRSSSVSCAEQSPRSPSRRALTVSILSPSKQTQTELFNFCPIMNDPVVRPESREAFKEDMPVPTKSNISYETIKEDIKSISADIDRFVNNGEECEISSEIECTASHEEPVATHEHCHEAGVPGDSQSNDNHSNIDISMTDSFEDGSLSFAEGPPDVLVVAPPSCNCNCYCSSSPVPEEPKI